MLNNYTQYGPITNGGIRARCDAAVCYRTILSVHTSRFTIGALCWAAMAILHLRALYKTNMFFSMVIRDYHCLSTYRINNKDILSVCNLLKITEVGALLLSSTSIEQNQNTFYNVHNSQHSCVVQVLFMCGFDKHLLAARLVPLPRHGNFTKKITYTSDFFIIIRYLLSTQSMISRLYLGKYKANAKKYTYLLKKGK